MSYYQNSTDSSNFFIKAKDIPSCYVAVVKAIEGEDEIVDESISTDDKVERIQDFLDSVNFTSEVDEEGDLLIDYEHNKAHSGENRILSVIAPFLEDHAYLEMEGSDNQKWRWVKLNGEIETKFAVITWPYLEK